MTDDDPEAIIADIEAVIAEAAGPQNPEPADDLDPLVRDHLRTIRRGADRTQASGE